MPQKINNVVFLGNKELLKLPKTAFLASITIPVDEFFPILAYCFPTHCFLANCFL